MNAQNSPFFLEMDSYLSWWRDGGVDAQVSDTPHNWMNASSIDATDLEAFVAALNLDGEKSAAKPIATTIQPVGNQTKPPLPPLPESLSDLPAVLGQICSSAQRPCVLPMGSGQEPLCIVTDMPTQDDERTGGLFSGEDGALLNNMLKAIGLARQDCYIFATLPYFTASPQTMDADAPYYQLLLRRHVSFLGARHMLVLGDLASRLIFDKGVLQSRANLHDVNHDSGHISASSCFHPHGLLKRPAHKRMAWQDLQLLLRTLTPQ